MNDDKKLGGSAPFAMSQVETPITWKAAALFNTSNARVIQHGGGLNAFVAVTQDNLAAILRALADLELEVQRLKRQQS